MSFLCAFFVDRELNTKLYKSLFKVEKNRFYVLNHEKN